MGNLLNRKKLYLDFETASELDLPIVGLDRYAKHKSTRVLMLAWAVDDNPVQLWRPDKGPMPAELHSLLLKRDVIKVSWTVPFEHAIFKQVLIIDIPWDEWIDPMVWARHMSLPGSLEDCGVALGIPKDKAKIKEGKRLIQIFCRPASMGGEVTLFGIAPPTFHDEHSRPADWKKFEKYCMNDVEAERYMLHEMECSPLPEREQKLWVLDQIINETGIPTNRKFVENAYVMAENCKNVLIEELTKITNLDNPNAAPQLLPWLKEHGYVYGSLNKKFVQAALANKNRPVSEEVKKVLTLRQDSSKTSYTKLETLINTLSDDDRLRNQFMFLGASRSGRWSGAGVQVHNLPRPIKYVEKNLDDCIRYADNMDYVGLTASLLKESEKTKKAPDTVISVMTSLIRSGFQAPSGKKLVVCDLNAIENRVLGWVSGCQSILDVFTTITASGRPMCPYLEFAANKMYMIPYEVLEKAYYEMQDADAKEKRQICKPVILGAGYGLGSGVDRICTHCGQKLRFNDTCCKSHPRSAIRYAAQTYTDKDGNVLKKGLMGYAENMGVQLTPEQAYKAWKAFRDGYPEVVQGWSDLENAAKEVISEGGSIQVGPVVFDRIERANGQFIMRIKLPSGRYLHYMNARVEAEHKTSESGYDYVSHTIIYDGIGHGVGAIGKGWGPVKTYGGKLMENVVQAISRDLLADAMMMAHERGAEIVLHVHDEIVTLADINDPFAFGLKDLQHCMSTAPDWAPGLPLHAEGFEGIWYKK